MKFKLESHPEGTSKLMKKFAWAPVECEENTVLWLEFYQQLQVFRWGSWDALRNLTLGAELPDIMKG